MLGILVLARPSLADDTRLLLAHPWGGDRRCTSPTGSQPERSAGGDANSAKNLHCSQIVRPAADGAPSILSRLPDPGPCTLRTAPAGQAQFAGIATLLGKRSSLTVNFSVTERKRAISHCGSRRAAAAPPPVHLCYHPDWPDGRIAALAATWRWPTCPCDPSCGRCQKGGHDCRPSRS